MIVFAKENITYLLVKNNTKDHTRWPTIECKFIFYEDTNFIEVEYVYLSKSKRIYRLTPDKKAPFTIRVGTFVGTNHIEELTGLKLQVAITQFNRRYK